MTTPWKGNEKVPVRYARIGTAYAYVELVIDGETTDGRCAWHLITEDGRNPVKVVDVLKQVISDDIASGELTGKSLAAAVVARAEMDDPLFLTYIAGKMGAY